MVAVSLKRALLSLIGAFAITIYLVVYLELVDTRLGNFVAWNKEQNEKPNETKVQLTNVSATVDLSPDFNPYLQEFDEPEGPLRRINDERVKASFVSLVRNKEAVAMIQSIREIQGSFNDKFQYPWAFFNDEEFDETFKERVVDELKPKNVSVSFHKIDPIDWEEPQWINRTKAFYDGKTMKIIDNVQHADETSYKRMCRWNSGKFYNHPALASYQYYWRVEPGTRYFCAVDYDVFAYLEDHNKDYGFVINIYDSPQSVRSLWPTVKEFFDKNPSYVHQNNSLQWLTQGQRPNHLTEANGYSTCHFWSNFEIGSLDFFRSKKYSDYFDYLDQSGGFFYERWGDAPVHSVALGLMTDKSRIHWFRDIGYQHAPYFHCPTSKKCSRCTPGKFANDDFSAKENCINQWFKVAGLG